MDKRYSAYVWIMIFYGFLSSMWQTYAYWLMGAMSNDPAKLAVFTGFCAFDPRNAEHELNTNQGHADKSLQSAGAAVVWRADAIGVP
jgi:hypothetical protein